MVDLAALKAGGKLPTVVEVTDGTTPVNATITTWTGSFDGTTTGTYKLTATWTMPEGYVDDVDPITVEITVNVSAVQTVDTTAQDNLDIAAARLAIEGATYTATQTEALNSAAAMAKAQALVNALELSGTTALVANGAIFAEAKAGTAEDTDGTNGSFTFAVNISKGLGTLVTSEARIMTITATAYVPATYALTLTGDNISSVPAAGNLTEGTSVTVTVAPAAGQQVATFTVGGADKKADLVANAYTFTITADTTVAVTYEAIPDVAIATAAIAGVTAPVNGATPVATIAATDEYTAAISWAPADATFGASTVYTATITITPKAGYTLTGVAADFFTVEGATATNDANSGVVTAVFLATDADPVNITEFDAIADKDGGKVGAVTYADAAAVQVALPTTVTANTGAVTVPVTAWADTENYDPTVAGSYTFTATLGEIPEGFTNTDNKTATVEVVVAEADQSGTPAFIAGTPATFDTELTVGEGTLGTQTNLTYTWYRSDDATYDEGTDTAVGTTGVTYTPVADDIGKYLIVVVTSTDATGNGVVATDEVVVDPVVAIAAAIKDIDDPVQDQTTLTLPTVPERYTIAIKSSSTMAILGLDGTIYPEKVGWFVRVVLTVTNTVTGNSADTTFNYDEVGGIGVNIPGNSAGHQIDKITVASLGNITVGDAQTVLQKAQALVDEGYTVTVNTADGTKISTSGVATVAGEGHITFTVTKDTQPGITASTEVLDIDVKAAPAVTSVTVDPATASVVQGGTQQLTATVAVVGGAAQTVTWTSSDVSGKVTVDEAGLVTVAADAAATDYTITATSTVDGSKTGTCSVTVNPAAATVSSAATTDATTIVLTMSSALTGTAGDPAAFTVAGAASAPTVTGVAVSGTTVTLTLSAAIVNGETITVTYAQTGTTDLTNGTLVANFSNQAVTNTI